MKRMLLLLLLLPATTFAQVSYTVTVTRLKAKADDCDGGTLTLCANAPQDPVFSIWSNDAEANENYYCWVFDNDPEAEYNLWKDIQNVEIANETNVLTTYLTFDMEGFESDNLNPDCSGSASGDDAVIDRQFVLQLDLLNLIEGGTINTEVLDLGGVYFAEVEIEWIDLTANVSSIENAEVRIAPNPSNGNFKVKTLGFSGDRSIEVIDMAGRTVLTQTTIDDETSISLEGIQSGSYFVHVRSAQGEVIEKIAVY